jgi:hypothetical protein
MVMFDVLLQVLLGDVGAGKSSLVLRFVKGQFIEFQVGGYQDFWIYYFFNCGFASLILEVDLFLFYFIYNDCRNQL